MWRSVLKRGKRFHSTTFNRTTQVKMLAVSNVPFQTSIRKVNAAARISVEDVDTGNSVKLHTICPCGVPFFLVPAWLQPPPPHASHTDQKWPLPLFSAEGSLNHIMVPRSNPYLHFVFIYYYFIPRSLLDCYWWDVTLFPHERSHFLKHCLIPGGVGGVI